MLLLATHRMEYGRDWKCWAQEGRGPIGAEWGTTTYVSIGLRVM